MVGVGNSVSGDTKAILRGAEPPMPPLIRLWYDTVMISDDCCVKQLHGNGLIKQKAVVTHASHVLSIVSPVTMIIGNLRAPLGSMN